MVVKEKLGLVHLKIQSDFKPSGDQPNAIKELVAGVNSSERNQVLSVLLVLKNLYYCHYR